MRIRSDLAARIEENLGELVVWRETNLKIRVKLFTPKCNDRPQGLCCERRGDRKPERGIRCVDLHKLNPYSIWRCFENRKGSLMGGTLLP